MKRLPGLSYLAIYLLLGFLSACEAADKALPSHVQLDPAFQIEIVAQEPLVFDPVDMEFDARGEAYVLEMPGYPLGKEQSRLVHLQDTNQDGVFDQRVIYADSLALASSFLPYREGMLVAAPPDLLFLADTDGDGKADQRQVLMSGFSNGNLQHNINGLTYGLDNWIYLANGGNDGKPYFIDAQEAALDMRNQDLRIHLPTRQMERIGRSSGGFELAFDTWGRMFETHNLEHISHLVFEDRYLKELGFAGLHSLENISDHEEEGLARIYPIGEQHTRVNHPEQSGYFSGACGIHFYGGGAFPQDYAQSVLVADVVLNLVHMDQLRPHGASFRAARSHEKTEFLASSDRAFRPVNFCTGPDGSLYLLDMHRDVIEHPEWIPDEIETELDLQEGKEKGRIYRIWAKHADPVTVAELNKAEPDALISALSHSNQRIRLTAQRLLVTEVGAEAIPALQQFLAQDQPSLARLHAMWSLAGLDALAESTLLALLEDPSEGLRENALKVSESYLNGSAPLLQKVLDLTRDAAPRVRMRAALCLSRLDNSVYRTHAKAIRAGLASILEREDNDNWTHLAVASAASHQALRFCQEMMDQPGALPTLELLAHVIGDGSLLEMEAFLQAMWQSEREQADKVHLISSLTAGVKVMKPMPSMNSDILEQIEASGSLALFRASADLRRALYLDLFLFPQLERKIGEAKQAVFDENLPLETRLEQLKLLAYAPFDQRAPLLYALLDHRQPLSLQKGALQQLWEAKAPQSGEHILKQWPNLGPQARKHAGDILLYHAHYHSTLLTALETGKIKPGELNLDLERRRTLLWAENETIRTRAEALFSDAGVITRQEALTAMRPALTMEGKVVEGKALFELHCGSCHRYGKFGQDVGPNLTEIHRKSRESLLHDILDPNAAVAPKYLNHSVELHNGSLYAGMIEAENDQELVIRMMGGKEVRLQKTDIESFRSLGVSLMPEGFEQHFNPQQMADLLAFLQQAAS